MGTENLSIRWPPALILIGASRTVREMKQTIRIFFAAALLMGMFAAGQRNEVAAEVAADESSSAEKSDDVGALVCDWGTVTCPDNGWSYTYTYGGGCWNSCAQAEFATPVGARGFCTNRCPSECQYTEPTGECS